MGVCGAGVAAGLAAGALLHQWLRDQVEAEGGVGDHRHQPGVFTAPGLALVVSAVGEVSMGQHHRDDVHQDDHHNAQIPGERGGQERVVGLVRCR